MTRTSRIFLEQRAFEMMAIIEREANPQTRTACIACRSFPEKLGVSENCVRFTLNGLLKNGWIAKCERFLPNGGQIENAYLLTPRGRTKLKNYLTQTAKAKKSTPAYSPITLK